MRPKRVILEIMPSLIATRVVRGAVVIAQRETPISQSDWGDNWTTSEATIRGAIEAAVQELDVVGRRAIVVYDLPSTSHVVSSAAANMPLSRALDSACLAAQNSMEQLDESAATAAIALSNVVPRDPAPRIILGIAESQLTLAHLTRLVESAGLRVDALVPRDAGAIVESCHALRASEPRAQVAAWIGRHSMVIAIARGGTLVTARLTSIGLSSLTDAIMRAPALTAGHSEDTRHVRTRAWSLLWSVGIPPPDAASPGSDKPELSGVLPHMQPVLQRIAVEIKQSLRFAVEAGEREKAEMTIVGPGASCPGLHEALLRFVGLENGTLSSASTPGGTTEGGVLLSNSVLVPRLLPAAHAERRVRRRVRLGLALGSAAALALAVHARMDANDRSRHAQSETASLAGALEKAHHAAELQQLAVGEQAIVAEALARLQSKAGDGSSMAGVLRTLSAAGAVGVQLRSVEAQEQPTAAPQVVLGALASTEGDAASANSIRSFIAVLERSPLVSSARLGSTQRVAVDGRDMLSFNVIVELVPLPARERLTTAGGAH